MVWGAGKFFVKTAWVYMVLKPVLFADDAGLFHAHTDFDTLSYVVNEELQNITTWCLTNKLSLNRKKIKCNNILAQIPLK